MADRLDALTVREHNGKSYWTKIGAAFESKGGGWIVRLDAMPASNDGQFAIHLRVPLPKDGQQAGDGRQQSDDHRGNRGAGQSQGASYGSGGHRDDLDDDVPF
ncbi:MAG: hypothetical protein EON59_03815 [Alphaproteobacteria bacterium]|nr:MAG: hypothetical protein EON59_03815 [Alphaproteobacteria bacterium]